MECESVEKHSFPTIILIKKLVEYIFERKIQMQVIKEQCWENQ